MKTKNIVFISVFVVVIVLIALYFFMNKPASSDIRLGYMTFWAEGAFPAEALQYAGIAEKNNLNISYVKVQYGPPLVEAALAKQVDVIFTGWVPAVTLMSKSDDWIAVSKLTYFPMALMARNGTNISEVKDLKGKKLGIAYGSGPYPIVMLSLKNNGLIPGKDIEVINMKPADMGVALQSSRVDAIAAPEPQMTLFEQQGLAYSIEDYNDIGFILFSKQFVEDHPEDVKKFLKAFKEAEFYVSQNKKQVYGWFSQESQYNISLLDSLTFTEPNFNAKNLNDIDLSVNQSWIDATQKKINFEFDEKIIDKMVNISEKVDLRYLP
jgi:sulfonate transport system substrate-binding protein